MKIDFSSLVRTNLGFPSEWTGKTTDDSAVKISYRYGKTNVFINGSLKTTLTLDPFDVGGYMDDHVLKKLLEESGLL